MLTSCTVKVSLSIRSMYMKDAINSNGIELIVAITGDHGVVAERAIRVIKDRAQCVVSELPWKLPISGTKHSVYYVSTQSL